MLPFLNNPKDLDPSYKTDLDLWDCFGRKNLRLITEEIRYICSQTQSAYVTFIFISLHNPSFSEKWYKFVISIGLIRLPSSYIRIVYLKAMYILSTCFSGSYRSGSGCSKHC